MSEPENDQLLAELASKLERDLFAQHGPMMAGKALAQALGYPSTQAMRVAIKKGNLPVPVFNIDMRRGKFALVKDVASWLAHQRMNANLPNSNDDETGGD